MKENTQVNNVKDSTQHNPHSSMNSNFQKNQENFTSKLKNEKDKHYSKPSNDNYLNKVFHKNNNQSKLSSMHKGSYGSLNNYYVQNQQITESFYSPGYMSINNHNRNIINHVGMNNIVNNMNYMTYSVYPVNNFYQNEPFAFSSMNYLPNTLLFNGNSHLFSDNKKTYFSVVIKLKSEEKVLQVYRGEDYEKKASQFCIKNKLSQKLVKPILNYILSAANCLDDLMKKEVTPFEHRQLDLVKETFNDYQNNLYDAENNLSLSCFTLPDENSDVSVFLNRSF